MPDARAGYDLSAEVRNAVRDAICMCVNKAGRHACDANVDSVVRTLRALPVEQRMEAMGMVEGGYVLDCDEATTNDRFDDYWPDGRLESLPFYVERNTDA